MKRLYKKDIDDRINVFTDVLADSIRHIGADTGWHQHLKTPKIGIVATSMALLYFNKAEAECIERNRCLNYIRSKVREDGGWSYISNATTISNIESTCWALLALNTYESDTNLQLIENGTNWILQSLNNQNQDSGWGFSNNSNPRIYITAFALRTLYRLGKSSTSQYESARQWLINSQNNDGGWGALPIDGSNIFFTCYCISTLAAIGIKTNDPVLVRAHNWLDQQLKHTHEEDTSLVCYMEFIEDGSGVNRIRIPFFHYVLPAVAKAYMDLGCYNKNLFKALFTLMKRSENGLIEHPNLKNSRIYPIWALYETSTAFIDFRCLKKNSWRKSFVFCCIFNKIYSYKKWSLLRVISFFSNWAWGALGIFIIVFFVTSFSEPIINYWNSIQDKSLGGLIISFIASVLYGICALITKGIREYLMK